MDAIVGRIFPRRNKAKQSDNTKTYLDEEYVSQIIVDGNLQGLVECPVCIEKDEWLAVNLMQFCNKLNTFLGCLMQQQTKETQKLALVYIDDKGKKIKCSSFNTFCDYNMTFLQAQLDDTELFPTLPGTTFPDRFHDAIKRMARCIGDVLTQIYVVQFAALELLDLVGHLNTFLLHFIYFVETFELIPQKEREANTLNELIKALKEDQAKSAAGKSKMKNSSNSNISKGVR